MECCEKHFVVQSPHDNAELRVLVNALFVCLFVCCKKQLQCSFPTEPISFLLRGGQRIWLEVTTCILTRPGGMFSRTHLHLWRTN